MHLKSHVPVVLQQYYTDIQSMTAIYDCLNERVDLELKYAKGLEKLATKLAPLNENYSSAFGINSQLATQLAEDLKSEVAILKEHLSQQKHKQLIEYLKMWEQEMSTLKSDVKVAENLLKQRKREFEIEGVLHVIYQTCMPDKVPKQSQKSLYASKEYESAVQNYKVLLHDYDDVWNEAEVEHSIGQLQLLRIERMSLLKDTLLKIFVHESSLNKSHLYDIDRLSERTHQVDPAVIIEASQYQNIQPFEPMITNSFITQTLLNPNQAQLTAQIYVMDPTLSDQGRSEQMKQLQESPEKCEEFINYLEWRYTNANQLQLSVQEFIIVTNLCIALLERCAITKEAYLIGRLLKGSFGFHTKDGQVRYVQEMLVNHQIWQQRDLWETLIIQQIIQLKGQPKDSQNSSILQVLNQISQQMLMFQLSNQLISDIVQKFCNFFKLNKEISQDLIQAINSQN